MLGYPKPEPRQRTKARLQRFKQRLTKAVRAAVFERDEGLCRVCGQPATDMHELVYRSQGGQISLSNSLAVCRDCHRGLHSHRIQGDSLDANGPITWLIQSRRFREDWR